MIWTFVVLQVISLACVIHLWARGRGSLLRKAVWSPLALLPLVGPLLYGAVYEVPSPQHAHLQGDDTHGATSTDVNTGT